MLDFSGKKILVIGLARSGRAVIKFLTRLGAQVTATDIKKEDELEGFQEVENLPVTFITGRYPQVSPGQYDLIIMSPGVPSSIPLVQAARGFGVPVWSELEFASRFIRKPIIAITGTNGKTTTILLLGHIFERSRKGHIVAGNIGVPLIQEVSQNCNNDVDYWIVEVSSFQLEQIEDFCPFIAVFLNLAPDHLDRHGTMENYGRIKTRLFENQGYEDFAVLNYDDPWLAKIASGIKSRIFWFSTQGLPDYGIGVEGNRIIYRFDRQKRVLCRIQDIRIPGPHNLENALAAAGVSLLAGIKEEVVKEGFISFPGVPHRLESVRVVKGVKYINDSKGTNPESVLRALDTYQEPIILIAGGKNKGSDFMLLARKINEKVKALISLGEAGPLINQAVRNTGFDRIWEVSSLAEAVQKAAVLAQPGDVVLLSPACASWDMFQDFEERGNLFRKLVYEL